jgi:hypothetical protein
VVVLEQTSEWFIVTGGLFTKDKRRFTARNWLVSADKSMVFSVAYKCMVFSTQANGSSFQERVLAEKKPVYRRHLADFQWMRS